MDYHRLASGADTQIRIAFHNISPALQNTLRTCEAWGSRKVSELANDEANHQKVLEQGKDDMFELYKAEMKVQAKLQAQVELAREHTGYLETATKTQKKMFVESHETLTDSMLPFNHYLGLDVEILKDGWVAFIFTLLDNQHPDRPCSFNVGLDERQNFVVTEVKPPVDYHEVYMALQESNNFPRFVRNMRKLFKVHVMEHPDAMLE